MAVAARCPSKIDFERLAEGKIHGEKAEQLLDHVEHCESCQTALGNLKAEDTLVGLLRGDETAADLSKAPGVAKLMEKLHSLAAAAAAGSDGTIDHQSASFASLLKDNSSPSIPVVDTQELYGFLGKPQFPDDIGTLGGYRILKILGSGGMGAVFLAEDPKLKRKIALKVMRPEVAKKTSAKDRFLREAQAAARIEHDYIIPILQIGEDDGIPFIAMPLLKGEPLDARLKRGRLSVPEILLIARQAAEALAAAQKHGMIHRDIKPGNIWLESTDDEGSFRVKILDFGLARLSGDEGHLTQSGAIMGTPAYMAPEQARGKEIDHRADLFSLGCVLYEMATGERPFTGVDTMAILSSLALDTPPEPISLNPDLPPALSQLIVKLLEKDVDKRPQSGREVADAIKKLLPENAIVVVSQTPAPSAPSIWSNLDAKNVVAEPSRAVKTDGPPKKRSRGLLIGCGLFGIAAIITLIIVIVRDKDGRKVAEVDVPGGNVEVREGAENKDLEKKVRKQNDGSGRPKADFDRAVAQWAIKSGRPGSEIVLNVKGNTQTLQSGADLPGEPFFINSLLLNGRLAEGELAQVCSLTRLNRLQMTNGSLIEQDFKLIEGCRSIESLSLQECRIAERGLAHLKNLPVLKALDLSRTDISDRAMLEMANIQSLVQLNFEGTKITDAGIEHLKKLSELRDLFLSGTQIGDAGLAHLAAHQRLHHLTLAGTRITDDGLQHLKKLPELDDLNLINNRISNRGMEHFAGMRNLIHLSLDKTQVTDDGLVHLENLDKLIGIWLPGGVKGPGLRHIRRLPLNYLHWTDAKVMEDIAFDHICSIKTLQFSILRRSALTDAQLLRFATLPNFHSIDIRGTNASEEGFKKLKLVIPNLKIHDFPDSKY